MMTIKEYANKAGVSYQAIYQQINETYKNELKDHVKKKGRTSHLTDEGVKLLDRLRGTNSVVIANVEQTTYIQQLEKEKEDLKNLVIRLQDAIISEQNEVKTLQKAQIKLIENTEQKSNEEVKLKLEIENLTIEKEELKENLAQKSEELNTTKEILEEEKNKSFWKRLFKK